MKIRWWHLAGGGTIYAGGMYAALVHWGASRPATLRPSGSVEGAPAQCGALAFDRLALEYDQRIGWDEYFMGIGLMRWWLMKDVKARERVGINPATGTDPSASTDESPMPPVP